MSIACPASLTASWKAAASWPLLTFALWACCLLQIRCEPAPPQPIDAGAPAVLDMSAPQLLDLMPVAPACVPCSWTAPYMGCDPSLCSRRASGQLCCVGTGSRSGLLGAVDAAAVGVHQQDLGPVGVGRNRGQHGLQAGLRARRRSGLRGLRLRCFGTIGFALGHQGSPWPSSRHHASCENQRCHNNSEHDSSLKISTLAVDLGHECSVAGLDMVDAEACLGDLGRLACDSIENADGIEQYPHCPHPQHLEAAPSNSQVEQREQSRRNGRNPCRPFGLSHADNGSCCASNQEARKAEDRGTTAPSLLVCCADDVGALHGYVVEKRCAGQVRSSKDSLCGLITFGHDGTLPGGIGPSTSFPRRRGGLAVSGSFLVLSVAPESCRGAGVRGSIPRRLTMGGKA